MKKIDEPRYLRFKKPVLQKMFSYCLSTNGENSSVSRIEQYNMQGKLVAKYCVHFHDTLIPATDACIMRMSLVNGGIEMLKASSNVYEPSTTVDLSIINNTVDKQLNKNLTKQLTIAEAFHAVKAA